MDQTLIKQAQTLDEFSLFLLLRDLTTKLEEASRLLDLTDSKQSHRLYSELSATFRHIMTETVRFGVTQLSPSSSRGASDDYLTWYHFWSDYYLSLTSVRRLLVNKLFAANTNLTDYFPSKRWNE